MRFIANENIPYAAVAALEAAGHDVIWVKIVAPGAADADVLTQAVQEQRIVLTFDKDFGELAARSVLPTTCGVVLLRLPVPKSADAGRRFAELITARDNWRGHFSVIEPGRIRMRSLA